MVIAHSSRQDQRPAPKIQASTALLESLPTTQACLILAQACLSPTTHSSRASHYWLEDMLTTIAFCLVAWLQLVTTTIVDSQSSTNGSFAFLGTPPINRRVEPIRGFIKDCTIAVGYKGTPGYPIIPGKDTMYSYCMYVGSRPGGKPLHAPVSLDLAPNTDVRWKLWGHWSRVSALAAKGPKQNQMELEWGWDGNSFHSGELWNGREGPNCHCPESLVGPCSNKFEGLEDLMACCSCTFECVIDASKAWNDPLFNKRGQPVDYTEMSNSEGEIVDAGEHQEKEDIEDSDGEDGALLWA